MISIDSHNYEWAIRSLIVIGSLVLAIFEGRGVVVNFNNKTVIKKTWMDPMITLYYKSE